MPEPTPPSSTADRNLLFGILALQMDFVSRDQLVAAMHSWVLDKAKPLGQILVEQQALANERRVLLEALVQEHVKEHGGDPAQSLAVVGAPAPVLQELRRLADPDLDVSSDHAGTPSAPNGGTTAEHVPSGIAPLGWRYVILRPHAKGGLGEVFVAEDTEFHREVAVKQIRADRADDPASRSRFLLEAEVCGRLEHPGIVPAHGLGTDTKGRPFYAMRLVQGETLLEAIRRLHAPDAAGREPAEGRLVLRQLLTRFVAVCNALAYAHSRGVIHRDVKPANAMLGKYGETLVVDWGLAKVVGRTETAATEREAPLPPSPRQDQGTQAGAALGTPAYMSPEQAAGRLEEVGPPTDIYGLGATLYCLLTGRPPVQGADPGEVLRKASRGDWVAPRQVNAAVPAALDAVCRKAMALRSGDRYATAQELAADVERWLADEPVSAYPEPWALRARRWLNRHRTLATGAVAAVAVAALSLGVVAVLLTEANEREGSQRRLAEAKEKEAREQRDEARQNLYAVNLPLAQRAWDEARVGHMRELLEAVRPRRADDKDLRAFEWHYLWRLCHAERLVLKGHVGHVSAVAISPDGKRLASAGGFDNTLRLWDAASGKELLVLKGHTRGITGVAFSPDGKRLASAGWDKTVRVWDAAGGVELFSITADNGVTGLDFSPDGKRLAFADDRTVRVWDAAGRKELLALPAHQTQVFHVAFSPNGKHLAALEVQGTLRLWDTAGGKELFALDSRLSGRVAFSADGVRLAAGSFDGTVWVWDAADGKVRFTLTGHRGAVFSVAFTPDGKRLASGSSDETVRVWDLVAGKELFVLKGHTGSVSSVVFTPDGKRLASAGDDTVRAWDAVGTDEPLALTGHGRRVGGLAFSPDGKRLASAGDNTLRVWDPRSGKELFALQLDRNVVADVAFSPDGKRLAAACEFHTVRLWEAAAGGGEQIVLKGPSAGGLKGLLDITWRVAFSPDGKRLAAADSDQTVRVWDAGKGEEPLLLKGHRGDVKDIAFAPDGKHLASAATDGLRVWDAVRGKDRFPEIGAAALSVAFSPNGKRLASGGWEKTVEVWDAADGKHVRTLKGHTGVVAGVAFSPDGKRLASAGSEGTVRIWDAVTGKELLALKAYAGEGGGLPQTLRVRVAFSPDGERLAAAGWDNVIRV